MVEEEQEHERFWKLLLNQVSNLLDKVSLGVINIVKVGVI